MGEGVEEWLDERLDSWVDNARTARPVPLVPDFVAAACADPPNANAPVPDPPQPICFQNNTITAQVHVKVPTLLLCSESLSLEQCAPSFRVSSHKRDAGSWANALFAAADAVRLVRVVGNLVADNLEAIRLTAPVIE